MRSFIFFLISLSLHARADEIITGSLFALPGLIESADSGLYVDVLKEIEKCLPPDVKIKKGIYPPARAMSNVLGKKPLTDFTFPAIANPLKEVESPFYYTKAHGKVSFVIYSNVKKPLKRSDLWAYKGKRSEAFPYKIETFPNIMSYFPFPISSFTCVDCGLKKVSLGRTDALIMAMDEMDAEIKNNKLKSLHRELYEDFDSVIAVAKTERGLKIKKILDEATDCALKAGQIQKAYLKVHKPYSNWQPE